jgi:hypothetical protein
MSYWNADTDAHPEVEENIIPRDFQGARLTYNQVLQINDLLEKIKADYYSFSFVQELRDLANQTFQRAYRSGDHDKIGEVGPELQVLDHVFSVAFSGGYKNPNIAPDPKHIDYLVQVEQDAQLPLPEELELEEQEFEQPLLEVEDLVEEDAFLQSLPSEVLDDIEPLSNVPQIAANQNKIRRLIEELRIAMEDDEPSFIIRDIERQIARTHEKLAHQLNSSRKFLRYNPYY